MNKKERIPVKVPILRVIHEAMLPIFYKSESLMEDCMNKNIHFSAADKVTLADIHASALSLKSILESCLEEAEEQEVELLLLSNVEFQIIINLSRVVETSTRETIGLTTLRTH